MDPMLAPCTLLSGVFQSVCKIFCVEFQRYVSVFETHTGARFTKRQNVLLHNFEVSGRDNDRISLKCSRYLGNGGADVTVKFHSDCKSLDPNLMASRRRQFLRPEHES